MQEVTINVTQARKNLDQLVNEVNETHVPIQITGKKANAVLISVSDWQAIQETLFLMSIPDMEESIREGLETPVDECSSEPGW